MINDEISVPYLNIVFTGPARTLWARHAEIIDDTDSLKVYIDYDLFMDSKIEDQITDFQAVLAETTEIGFSSGFEGSYIPQYKNVKHIYTNDLGFKVSDGKAVKFKVMAVFRNKE